MMYHTDVGFTVESNVPNVNPPFKKGHRDSVWVKTKTEDKTEIKKAAQHKMLKCYGVEISDIVVYDGSTFKS